MYPILGRLGDVPTLKTTADADWLLTLVYQSTHNSIVYDDFAKFQDFVTEKGHVSILRRHADRKLAQTSVKEVYTRYAKALIAVGSGSGQDQQRGMEFEIVALTNPYSPLPANKMRFQLLYQGAPFANNQMTVIGRAPDGSVTQRMQQTDTNGQVTFKLKADHIYLVDAVLLRELARDLVVQTRGAVWESLWASLTFRVPETQ